MALSNPYLSHLCEDDEGGDVDQVLTLDTPCLVFGRYAQARPAPPHDSRPRGTRRRVHVAHSSSM